MPNRFNLPDVDFFEKDPDKILLEMLNHIYEKTGLEFERADPRRKFVEGLAAFVSFEHNRHDFAIKQNLLAYAEDNALDLKGDELQTPRLQETPAKTSFKIVLDVNRTTALVIPSNTRFKLANTYWENKETVVIPVGIHEQEIEVECTDVGTAGNDYLPGEKVTAVTPLPFVVSIENLLVTSGGADIEENDPYAGRIRLAPEKFSTAGPELAYAYFALSASQDITDVKVDNPSPGVTRILVLLKDGELPQQQHLDAVLEKCSATDVRPLTDSVIATAPNVVTYDVHVQYWLPKSLEAMANLLIPKIEARFAEYLAWQKSKIGRDINPTELSDRLKNIDENTKGAARVEIDIPYTVISDDSIAVANDTSIEFMGFVDE